MPNLVCDSGSAWRTSLNGKSAGSLTIATYEVCYLHVPLVAGQSNSWAMCQAHIENVSQRPHICFGYNTLIC
jgi:hypothetical protein